MTHTHTPTSLSNGFKLIQGFKLSLLGLAAASILAACGSGETGQLVSNKAGITKVKVMGDSLLDSGTFAGGGIRTFSVQDAATQNMAEYVAVNFGVNSLCNVFVFTGTTFVANPTAGCTNSAIGGARINNPASVGGTASPQSILTQLAAAGAAGHAASDLLIIDGGGNDAADLVGAYLGGAASFGAQLSTLITPASTNPAVLGAAYMSKLADNLFDAINTHALGKGATHVAVINVPGITLTPRFQAVLGGIQASAGATARAQSEALFDSWVQAFNAQLAARAAGNSKVAIVDLYSSFKDQVANPAQYGFTNVTVPACPIVGVDSSGLPAYNFAACTATALSAMTPPAGATGGANWWKTYAFSDGFHPTPYGHKLAGELIGRALAIAGWL